MFPTNHKTIFVLDHTPYFGISSDNPIDFDVSKSRGPGYVPLPSVCKSLWTCSVEAAVEYCRIVWDLFPEGKLVRFVVSDSAAHILNTWAIAQQNLTHVLNGLCLVGPVRRGAGGDVVGLCAAIEALAEPSPTQAAQRPTDMLFQNRGRIICITSARDDDSIRSLAEIALNTLIPQNKKASTVQPPTTTDASTSTQSLVVHYCHLVIINVTPEKADTRVNNQPVIEMGGGLMGVEVIVCRASALANLLGRLVLPHYRLVTTTVTGIPMKEEQNASSSANYDVEIIHSAEAHAGLRALQTAAESTESVVLRWWTPRGAEGGAGGCNGPLWRVTPADVASRPSACLVNFLLNGRSVTLEVPRKGGGRSASHVLAAQGGELWIGALGGRTPYEDPPALSEGAGGRVTDYRGKSSGRRDEQWRQVWGELEALIRAHSASPAHRALLRTLLECRSHNNHNTEGESSRASVIRATTDSPLSPVGAGNGNSSSDVWAPRNVLDTLLGAPRPPRRPDFAGRMVAGSRVATLYQHLQQDVETPH
ncbi:jg8580 [Pararge aegeria aegeria]|uniref:Protein asunder n=1 Tax=Pararge aegeria aegeria TaxID=348720 RepID=A0A8S4RI21_9NEOP|nr:jg8580 [Pararge aegeria aegeria]